MLRDFDDTNLPSLLSIPLLSIPLLSYEPCDEDVYAATRARILSDRNPYYFEGSELKGLGSRHTAYNFVWPLATAVEALTADSEGTTAHQAEQMRDLLKMASGNGLAQESVNVDNLGASMARIWMGQRYDGKGKS